MRCGRGVGGRPGLCAKRGCGEIRSGGGPIAARGARGRPNGVRYSFAGEPGGGLFQNPEKILAPHVRTGMRVLDVGYAMGFFSLPMARLVGPNGRVVCVDLQQKMLDSLTRRARRAQVLDRIEVRRCGTDSLSIEDAYPGSRRARCPFSKVSGHRMTVSVEAADRREVG